MTHCSFFLRALLNCWENVILQELHGQSFATLVSRKLYRYPLDKTNVLGPRCACPEHACGFISFSVLQGNATKHVNNSSVQEANYNNERGAHLEWIFDLQAFQGHLGHMTITWPGMGTHSSDSKNNKWFVLCTWNFLCDKFGDWNDQPCKNRFLKVKPSCYRIKIA